MSTVDDLYTQAMALPVPERAADAEEAWAAAILARSDALHRGELTIHDWREAIQRRPIQNPKSKIQNRTEVHRG